MLHRAVITGVGGLIGSHLASHLLQKGWRVLGIDNLSGGSEAALPTDPSFKFATTDLLDHENVGHLLQEFRPSVVYHAAAYAAEGLSPFIRRFNYTQNLIASVNIINECISLDTKLVYFSSMAVYGSQVPPFRESMPLEPIDPYGIAKAAVEQDIRVAGEQHGLRWAIVRPHNVIGENQNIWDRYRNVIGIFIRRGLAGLPLQVFGSGNQLRAFSDVRSYMKPLEILAEDFNHEIFNLGSDRPTTVLSAAEIVVDELIRRGIPASYEFVEARHEVSEAFCDHSKAKRDLAFLDRTNLREVVSRMTEWAIAQPRREIRSIDYELTRGIYSYWA